MKSITEKQILAIMPHAGTNAARYTPWMNRFAAEYGINTPMRWAHYLAQIAVESGELRYSEELASGDAYEGRKNLGNTQPGDGRRFKGRGLIQLTGRRNYRLYSDAVGYDFTRAPSQLSRPGNAVRSSMWFWNANGLNRLADLDNVVTITRRINGGFNGLARRKAYLERAKKALS